VVEPDENPTLIEQIGREAGVVIGGDLSLDGLGPAGSYTGMFLAHVRAIVRTLE
jgi:hypothetical protein